MRVRRGWGQEGIGSSGGEAKRGKGAFGAGQEGVHHDCGGRVKGEPTMNCEHTHRLYVLCLGTSF